MLLGWKNPYNENEYTTQSNLQIQCHPYQTTKGIFHRTRTKHVTICMETQKTPNSQSLLRKKDGTGGINLLTSDYTTKLQSSRQYGTDTKTENIYQCNKIENPEVNTCTYGYLVFDKGGNNT